MTSIANFALNSYNKRSRKRGNFSKKRTNIKIS